MSAAPLLPCVWTGTSFEPRKGFQKVADKHYVVGENYTLAPYENRSDVSHRHEFAWLRSAWMSLPEDLAALYPTAEHLRKRALIEAGFYDETVIDAGTRAAAVRVATLLRSIDDFSFVIVRGPIVVRRVAKSQSHRAMDRKDFQASKTAIMEVIAAMVGVTTEQLQKASAA